MLTILLNGVEEKTEDRNLSDLIISKKLKKDQIIIEVNGTIIKKDDLEKYLINNGDKIEIIRFMGGG